MNRRGSRFGLVAQRCNACIIFTMEMNYGIPNLRPINSKNNKPIKDIRFHLLYISKIWKEDWNK